MLLNVRKQLGAHGIGKIYGTEKNITTYNLARMNMLLHGVKDNEFEIYHGDSLLNDWDMFRESNPAKKMQFDAIVANPPFSYRWEPNEAMADDVRFKSHGLAPKSAADFAFLLHGFHFLKDEGVMAIILPHGVLFRGGAEERIRKKLLLDGHIRMFALQELGFTDAPCLIAKDDESYTYNNRINRLSTIQEHFMIRRAVDRGVTPERASPTCAAPTGRGRTPLRRERCGRSGPSAKGRPWCRRSTAFWQDCPPAAPNAAA
mgnify:CR=1 FL=1